MKRKSSYQDVVIIGGGPAGLMAARSLCQDPSISLTLIEKSLDYSKSIVCGEGVWKAPFDTLLPHNSQWIQHTITTADFKAPDGTSVLLQNEGKPMGYILKRAQMQEDLLKEISAKSTVLRGKKVVYCAPQGSLQSVQLDDGTQLTTKLIIDAAGPNSPFGKEYNLAIKAQELEPAAYALVKTSSQDNHSIMLQMSSILGPGGYFWSFPSSNGIANVGAVFGRGVSRPLSIREAIKKGVTELFPTGEILSWHGGSIPNYHRKRPLTARGFIQCGDSAELVNSISRSGISEAMQSGVWAGEYAMTYVTAKSSKEKRDILQHYERKLYKEYGKAQEKVAKVKQSLYHSITDEQFNKAAREINKIPLEKRTMWDILRITCWRVPKLLWALRHLL